MLQVASPRLRMDTMFTSGVSGVFAVFTIPYVWPDLPGSTAQSSGKSINEHSWWDAGDFTFIGTLYSMTYAYIYCTL